MNFRALNKNLIIRVACEAEESKTANGIIVNTRSLKNQMDIKWLEGEVVSIGSAVESDLSVGDVVRFDRYSGDSFDKIDSYEYLRVSEGALFAVRGGD